MTVYLLCLADLALGYSYKFGSLNVDIAVSDLVRLQSGYHANV